MDERLIDFVQRVRPGSMGWKPIYKAGNLSDSPYLLRALGLWVCAVILLFGANFIIGHALLGGFS